MSISPLVSQSHDTVNSRHCDMTTPFWQTQSLEQMTPEEWESLCDGCGRCCLQKLEDEETGEVHNTSLACQLLDIHSCRCSDYEHRKEKVPQCLKLTAGDIPHFHWLPDTCAYRLLAEGKSLFDWHPLISGNPNSVHLAGISVRAFAQSETSVPEEDWEDYIIPMRPV
ncbi:YcgN family cysteine cluster protein [Endozoicomonas sp. ALC020]|uniref:YcgN family cysteine cluster protein n=1 Tax=unclassified Endozoicomonas TaxID=2644528 RepID=UPI003BB17F17